MTPSNRLFVRCLPGLIVASCAISTALGVIGLSIPLRLVAAVAVGAVIGYALIGDSKRLGLS